MIVIKVVKCPVCSSQKSYKDGIRYTRSKKFNVTDAENAAKGSHNLRKEI